eukprot:9488420-Ditylum_brightwellii.AAC.1
MWHHLGLGLSTEVGGYISARLCEKKLTKLCKPCPKKPEYLLHCHIRIKYGLEGQLVPAEDMSPKVPQKTIDYFQEVVGILLWYRRILDLTLLPALNDILSQQAAPMEETVKVLDHFLNYMATYPNVAVHFHVSNMILHIHSDAVYMVLPEAQSRAGVIFIFPPSQMKPTPTRYPHNGAIHNECSTICNVMGSAAKEEVGGLYVKCQCRE